MSKWVITGVAGFIGSNILEELLNQNQTVVGVDNLSSGKMSNLDDVQKNVGSDKWKLFTFIKGDKTDITICQCAVKGADYILHHAALVSVPESFNDIPLCVSSNVTGFVNIVETAKKENVKKVIYASSCAVEQVKSPYAISKLTNELLANIETTIDCIGLRYYNIYGPRQDINSSYSAVIPTWINSMLNNKEITIYGTGETTRDFIHVSDVVKANIQAALNASEKIKNVGTGVSTSLNELYNIIKKCTNSQSKVIHKDFRQGDILHSCAKNSSSDYIKLNDGILKLTEWYKNERKDISN